MFMIKVAPGFCLSLSEHVVLCCPHCTPVFIFTPLYVQVYVTAAPTSQVDARMLSEITSMCESGRGVCLCLLVSHVLDSSRLCLL